MRLHSVMLGTEIVMYAGMRDIDASVAFYATKLGLTVSGRFGDFAMFDANGATITLQRPADACATRCRPSPR